METRFYSGPIEQAAALIEECQGCLEEAVGVARMRALQCDWRDDHLFLFWMSVLRNLPRSVQEFDSMNTPASGWN